MSNVVNMSGQDRALRLSFGDTVQNNRVKTTAMTWPAFAAKLTEVKRTPEKLDAYFRMPREAQDRIKDVGYYVPGAYSGTTRKKADLVSRECLTLDLDFAPENWRAELSRTYSKWTYALHTTHKHRPESPRLRLVFPLKRPVSAVEYEAIGRYVASMSDVDWYDDTTYQYSRVMHLPSASADGEFIGLVNDADWLCPDEILGLYFDWRDTSEWPLSSREAEAPRLSMQTAQDPTEKRGIVGAFCRSFPISRVVAELLPDVYAPGLGEGRYSFLLGTTANGAVSYEDKWLYSHHGTDRAHLKLVNAFDLVRLHRYADLDEKAASDTPVNRLPSYEAMVEFANTFASVRVEALKDRIAEYDDVFDVIGEREPAVPVVAMPGEIDPFDDEAWHAAQERLPVEHGKTVADAGAFEDDSAWMAKLRVTAKGEITKSIDNLVIIMRHDGVLKGCVRANTFEGRPKLCRSIGPHRCMDPVNGSEWTDNMELWVMHYIAAVYGLEWSAGKIFEAANLVADTQPYHPVRDYLDGLLWDGQSRLDTLLVRIAGAEDSIYTRQATRKALVAAVARIYHPGVKFDCALILEGVQGARKSTLLKAMAVHPSWFCDNLTLGMDAKEVIELTQGKWIVEVQEMVARTNAEVEHVKAFLSRASDTARAAYARRASSSPRQFVVFGTTNRDDYLSHSTGNRRFWPVRTVGQIDIDTLLADRDQLWAEAKVLWESGEFLDLEDNAKLEADAARDARMETDPWEDAIAEWLKTEVPVGYYKTTGDVQVDSAFGDSPTEPRRAASTREVWQQALLQHDIGKLSKREGNRIFKILRKLTKKDPVKVKWARYGGITTKVFFVNGWGDVKI